MIGCLRTRVHKQPIIALYFEFYNLEAWLHSDIHDAEIVPDNLGYEMIRRDRLSRGGGVLILVSKKYIAQIIDEF